MAVARKIPLFLIVGAALGALILGVVGRAAMAGVALVTGSELNLSLKGLLEVVIAGTILGAVGGLLFVPVRRLARTNRLARSVILGSVLFACSLAVSLSTDGMALGPELPITLVVVAAVFLGYGLVLEGLLTRME
jgi:hypothetical protein